MIPQVGYLTLPGTPWKAHWMGGRTFQPTQGKVMVVEDEDKHLGKEAGVVLCRQLGAIKMERTRGRER